MKSYEINHAAISTSPSSRSIFYCYPKKLAELGWDIFEDEQPMSNERLEDFIAVIYVDFGEGKVGTMWHLIEWSGSGYDVDWGTEETGDVDQTLDDLVTLAEGGHLFDVEDDENLLISTNEMNTYEA